MKTKYVKVPVSERLPEDIIVFVNVTKEEIQAIETARTSVSTAAEAGGAEYYDYAEGINKQIKNFFKKKKVLKPVPNHSEEMLSMLEEVKDFFQPHFFQYPLEGQEEFINQIEKLINKVKDNGNAKETDKKAT
ncbi:TPA: hypothetical protein JRX02_002941 [Elizabethkingia anophelis]|uniref:hypothetical protein n=1 Tax=Elizabethkingia anophelis TaxID=1117645 RepID=UPI00296B8ED9|nr:hypothetical protein [Elizabethkingia anophelis]HAY3504315.1 hypothetical protein [Elizabethkingia anophelis]HAY3512292.1 hypothetical protein [Elizabethkingia anophelis]HAY3516544.1 hypothetical protein [Elizabethkingia anophelis]HAY3520409.1 hypothetical protein [Elizabethkingia anophelis]